MDRWRVCITGSTAGNEEPLYQLDRVGAFSDDIRDGIKGSVFDSLDKGFVSGKEGMEESIKFGVVAATPHPQVMISKNDKKSTNGQDSPDRALTTYPVTII